MTNLSNFKELKALVEGLEADVEKFYNKGNGAAGTRLRKGLQDLKGLSQNLRLGIQELKNGK